MSPTFPLPSQKLLLAEQGFLSHLLSLSLPPAPSHPLDREGTSHRDNEITSCWLSVSLAESRLAGPPGKAVIKRDCWSLYKAPEMSYKTPGIGETNYCTASSSYTPQPQWMISLLGFFFSSALLAGHQPWWPELLEESSHSPGLHLWVSEVAWAYEGEMTKRKSSTLSYQPLCLFSDTIAKCWQWLFTETIGWLGL